MIATRLLRLCTGFLAVFLLPALSSAETITVLNNQGHSIVGTLRHAVHNAVSGDTIVFHSVLDGSTINLEFTLLIENKDLIIDASSLPNGITISGDEDGDGNGDWPIFDISLASDVTLRSLNLTDGRAADGTGSSSSRGGRGGGAVSCTSSTLTMEQCAITNSRAGDGSIDDGGGGNGGAISVFDSTMILKQCTLADNRAGDAVGFYVGGRGGAISAAVSMVTLEQCTIASNHAGEGNGLNDGGGFRINGGSLTLEQCTIANNRAGEGGGIFNDGGSAAVMIIDSIVAGNTADGGEAPDLNTDGNTTAGGINVIGDNTLVGGSESSVFPAGPTVGTGAAPLNAVLGPLADNGGPYPTLLPLRGSPALNPSGGASTSAFPTDQRGYDRIVAGILDVGAVEAPDYATADAVIAAAAAAAAAEKSSQTADLSKKLKKLKKKLKNAKRKMKVAKVKRFKKKIKKLTVQLRAL